MQTRVYGILEYDAVRRLLGACAITSMGRRLAEELEPAEERDRAIRLTEETKEAESITLAGGSFPLMSFSPVEEELKRLKSGAGLGCAELMRISLLMKAAKKAKKGIKKDEERARRLLPEIAAQLYYDDYAISRIDESILGEDEVADGASSELRRIRKNIRSEHAFIREKLNSMIRSREYAKYLQDAIITERGGRFVVPVKQEYRGNVSGLVHGESASGATLFIEPMSVVEANNRLRVLEEQEQREIERILLELSDLVRPDTEALRSSCDLLAYLDLVFAKAALAIKMKALPVRWNEEGRIEIRNGRHPLIDPAKVIPVSLTADDRQRTLIITGPNTGGKTVTLKLVGLFALMAQSGLFLPAAEGTSLPVFSDVFADIGDEQSIEQSLSTFSSHMRNITYILRKAERGCLILLDELGAGTDPEEGTALALAILDELNGRGAKVIATTHYGEIKAYAMTAEGFCNASMEFDAQSLMPTYRLVMGVAGASNAFLISKRLGLKPAIIEKARGFMRDERLEFDHLLLEAERTRKNAQRELEKAKEMQEHAKEVDARAKKLEQELAVKRESAIKQAQKQALEIVSKAQEETEEIIREIKKLKKIEGSEATKTVERARGSLSERRETLKKQVEPKKKPQKPVSAREVTPGQSVHIVSLGVDGTVLEKPDAKGMTAVQAGIMKLSVHFSDLERKQGERKAKFERTSRVSYAQKAVPLSINLHGYNVEDALVEVDQYLDDAFMAGLTEVSIIHGKGTGTLRSGVQSYLRRHPHVASFRLGKYGEGETGVTVVTLK